MKNLIENMDNTYYYIICDYKDVIVEKLNNINNVLIETTTGDISLNDFLINHLWYKSSKLRYEKDIIENIEITYANHNEDIVQNVKILHNLNDILNLLKRKYNDEIKNIKYLKTLEIPKMNMIFLSKKEAENYLEKNKKYFSKNAKVKAMTYNMDTSFVESINILRKIDFEKSNIIFKN